MRLEFLLKPQVLVLLVIGIIASIFGSRAFLNHRKKAPVPYSTMTPERRDIIQFITCTGTIKAKNQISIGSLAAGKVAQLLVDDNDIVKKDQILAVLDNGIGKNGINLATAQLEQAQAQLKYQERFFNRQKELYDAQDLAENTFDQITLQYEQAKAKVNELAANLAIEKQKYEDQFIRSPENGIITARRIELGQMITSQLDAKVLFEVVKDLSDMEIWADVDEADIGMVKDGQEARFYVDAYPNKAFTSKVRLIQYNAKTVDSSITYAAVLTAENKNFKLRPGMTANVDIKVAEKKQALCLPYSALRINSIQIKEYAKANKLGYEPMHINKDQKLRKSDAIWVFENDTFKQQAVKFGARDGSYVEIVEGVTEAHKVIKQFIVIKDNTSILKNLSGRGGLGK